MKHSTFPVTFMPATKPYGQVIAAAGLLSLVSTAPIAAQQASFVYRLGRDTVAIEQFTRAPNRVTGEMVQRTGAAVALVRYDVALDSEGRPVSASFRRVQADGMPFPNNPTEVRLTFTPDSVTREVVRGDSVQRTAYRVSQAMVAFPVYVYGPVELLAARRRRGGADSIAALGMAGNPGFIGLEAAGGDTLRLRGAPYPMRFVFDAAGLLQAVDGSMTTNKVMATRGPGGIDLAAIARALRPTGVLSARDVARGAFGAGGIVLVDYSRPSVRERTVWGGTLVPVDSIWRAGANDATHLFTTRTLTFGALAVPPGTYTLWIQYTRNGTFLIVNRKIGQWGTEYDASQDVGRIPMQMTATPAHVEEFMIAVRNLGQNRGALEFAWGDAMWSAAFTATAR
ncbi:MAG TPA: DUF2911 domain-containing protein [Gemmatimonadaceae bacterium]